MTRALFEQVPFLREELAALGSRPEAQGRARQLRDLLGALESLAEGLPDPKARIIARKVLEHGGPVPWKQVVAELGYRWTVGKARYAYSRVCRRCFPREGGEPHGR